MSEQNDKLTAEEMAAKFAELSKPELFKGAVHGIYGENAVSDLMRQYEDAANFAFNYTAQQVEHATAELRKELEAKENGNNNLKIALEEARKSIIKAASVESECFKKIESLNTQLVEAQRQRDEAVKLIKRYLSRKSTDNILVAHDLDMDCEEWISRLSSGEAKQEFKCVHGLPSDATCIGCLDDSHKPPPKSLTDKK